MTDAPTTPSVDTSQETRRSGRLSRMVSHNLFWPLVALVAMLAANTIYRPNFLAVTVRDGHLFGSLIDILRNSAPLMLVALGMTLIIATRGIDLSVGAIVAISGALALSTIQASPNPDSVLTVASAIGMALALCLVLGAWNGFMVAVLGIQPIIATLILMMAGRGIAMLITNGFITTVNSTPYKWLGSGWVLGLPVPAWIAGAMFLIVLLVCRKGALGMLIEAVGINPAAARLAGVRARTITWTVYIVGGLFAGIAGLLLSANVMAADANNAGLFIELDAILAVVIGGTSLAGGKFSLSGTVIGVFIITTLSLTVTILGISPLVTPLFKALVVIAVTLLQSPVVRDKLEHWGRRRPQVQAVAA